MTRPYTFHLLVIGFTLAYYLFSGFAYCAELATQPEIPSSSIQTLRADEAHQIALIDRLTPSLVAIYPVDGSGTGTGVIISEDGYALTNFHVVQPCGIWMKVGLAGGRVYHAVTVGMDPVGDVALIKILPKIVAGPGVNPDTEHFQPVTWGDSDNVQIGDRTWVLGNPFGFQEDFTPTVSHGIVSGTHRYQYPAGTFLEYADCLQVDAPINPGNSGGPLFNDSGELIGINGRCSFEKRGRVNVGVGYAISINQIRYFLSHLRSGRILDHATLGATVTSDSLGRPVVNALLDDAEVALYGMDIGDRILTFAGYPIETVNEFKNLLGIFPRGWVVPIEFARKIGKKVETYAIRVRLPGAHSEAELRNFLKQTFSENSEEKPEMKPENVPEIPEEVQKMAEVFNFLNNIPKEVQAVYEKRDGYVNFYFNRLETMRIWKAFKNETVQGTTSEIFPNTLSGVNGENVEFTLDFKEDRTILKQATVDVLWENRGDYLRQAEPATSRLLVPGLTLWHDFCHRGPEALGLCYFGESPLPFCDEKTPSFDDLSDSNSNKTTYDVLEGNVGGVLARFFFTTQNPARLIQMELDPLDGTLPWEFRFRYATGKEAENATGFMPTSVTIYVAGKIFETLYFGPQPKMETLTTPDNHSDRVEVSTPEMPGFSNVVADLQPKMVKIYGAGGFAEMEEYQSGFFVSEDGLIATVFSPVLNTDELECVLFDGRHFPAKIIGVDPVLEIALLKIEKATTSFFDLEKAKNETQNKVLDAMPILALSNLFNVAVGNEPVSAQAGFIASTTQLHATRHAFATRYHGTIFVLDVTTNNPGAAGGALVSTDGKTVYGMLGKELQHARTGCWLNFALPVSTLWEGIQKILAGKAQTATNHQLSGDFDSQNERTRPARALRLEDIGLKMVPEVVPRTPAFIDAVHSGSRAETADLRADDLVLYVNGRLIQSLEELRTELEFIDYQDPFHITILRGEEILEKDVK